MITVVYDGSFAGLLTAIFEVYEYKFPDVRIERQTSYQKPVFGNEHCVITNEVKANRVWTGLKQRLSPGALQQLYRTFLSEIRNIEDTILAYIRYAFHSRTSMECDYGNKDVLTVSQTAKKVYREKHRMEAFVRFQQTKDQLYYAVIEPDFNVLPLIVKHFKERYADQRWMIYDARRKYGIYYDLLAVNFVEVSFDPASNDGQDIRGIYDEKEELYQKLWQQYFTNVNIPSRKNLKLHIQHMPRRYWRYLPEKLAGVNREL